MARPSCPCCCRAAFHGDKKFYFHCQGAHWERPESPAVVAESVHTCLCIVQQHRLSPQAKRVEPEAESVNPGKSNEPRGPRPRNCSPAAHRPPEALDLQKESHAPSGDPRLPVHLPAVHESFVSVSADKFDGMAKVKMTSDPVVASPHKGIV